MVWIIGNRIQRATR